MPFFKKEPLPQLDPAIKATFYGKVHWPELNRNQSKFMELFQPDEVIALITADGGVNSHCRIVFTDRRVFKAVWDKKANRFNSGTEFDLRDPHSCTLVFSIGSRTRDWQYIDICHPEWADASRTQKYEPSNVSRPNWRRITLEAEGAYQMAPLIHWINFLGDRSFGPPDMHPDAFMATREATLTGDQFMKLRRHY